jgi:hypothetical protein
VSLSGIGLYLHVSRRVTNREPQREHVAKDDVGATAKGRRWYLDAIPRSVITSFRVELCFQLGMTIEGVETNNKAHITNNGAALQSVDFNGGSSRKHANESVRNKFTTLFPVKLRHILDDCNESIISWSSSGRFFTVHDP